MPDARFRPSRRPTSHRPTSRRPTSRRPCRCRAWTVAGLVALLGATSAVAQPSPNPCDRAPGQGAEIDAVFLLDTTGSMSGLIATAKEKIWRIADQLAEGEPEPDIRMGLVAYRDRGDDYVTRVFDLTDDLDQLYGHLTSFEAAGGGDTPESVNQALHDGVHKMSWRTGPSVYRVIFLVGDAPPKMDYEDDVKYAVSAAEAARRDIVVNTLQCGGMDETRQVWQHIAGLGGGRYVMIPQDAQRDLTTPMDAKLRHINQELAGTVVPWGSEDEKETLRGKAERAGAASAEVAASRLAYMDKKGKKVTSGRSDLIDALASGEIELDAVPENQLPEHLQAMDPDRRRQWIEDIAARRRGLLSEVAWLTERRKAYLEEKQGPKAQDAFDQQVLDAIREQALKKCIRYGT